LFTFILPYIEEQSVYDQIDFKFDWFDKTTITSKGIKNNAAFAKDIDSFLCPSTENRPGMFTTDYNFISRIDQDTYCTEIENKNLAQSKRSVDKLLGMLTDTQNSIRKVSDGMSHTIMFIESAGRPNHYVKGRTLKDLLWEEEGTLAQPGAGGGLTDYQWGDGGFAADGSDGLYINWASKTNSKPTTVLTDCPISSAVMNCDNWKGVYSFHSGGCNITFGDGSVQFVKEDASSDTFISLITRGAGDQTGEF
jgi:prepilin-type processing-associated H-X9-DG protein